MHKFYRLYLKLQRLRRRFRAPVTLGSRALVVRQDQVLLVRLTYVRGWYLPGGGVDRHESFYEGVVRELEEECGVRATDVELFGLYFNGRDKRLDHVAVYLVRAFEGEVHAADPREIAEVRFFARSEMPEDLWPGHRRRVEEYFSGGPRDHRW